MDDYYICGECRREIREAKTESWKEPDGTDQGYHWETASCCPTCGSMDLIPAHLCADPDCYNLAEEDKLLCDECFRDFIRKYLFFYDRLTDAEKQLLDNITDGEALGDVADSLRRSDEWQRSRL